MSLRVVVTGEVNPSGEAEAKASLKRACRDSQKVLRLFGTQKSVAADPKLSDLSMGRLKVG